MAEAGAATSMGRRIGVYRRAFDVVVSSVLLVLCLPVMVLAAVGSAISLRAWPFFTQDRVGADGRTFRFLKIRTMPTSVPAYADKHELAHYRTSRFCETLRKLHLDELPQLLLVLSGRMSLVGPRPEMPTLHALMPPSFAQQRTSVRPGCTGLWQISTGCRELIGTSPEFDLYYLTNRTVRLDCWILCRTALKMLRPSTRIAIEDVPDWALPAPELTEARLIDLRLESHVGVEATCADGSAIAAELT